MKTIDDNEVIDTSRGKKRIGALFDENAMLHATNKDLLLVQNDLLAALEAMIREFDVDFIEHGSIEIKQARAAISRARGTP